MAQTEDTELRDLVIEALEKNGSLAKIRALLRANIFLAFEDECDNLKQNPSLENILKIPEGLLSLSIVYEFLEFCNLKNTLFVYMAESKQGKEYNTESKKVLLEKLNLKNEVSKEPILITLIKLYSQRKEMEENDKGNIKKDAKSCTYIVEDTHSSATSNSQSDSSSDEKNKLRLRLQLDNSDTDTSNDSARDKVSSEYFPSAHIQNYQAENKSILQHSSELINVKDNKNVKTYKNHLEKSIIYQNINDFQVANNSSESTSYAELKPFNSLEEKFINTGGVFNEIIKTPHSVSNDSVKSATLGSNSAISLPDDNINKKSNKEAPQEIEKSDVETAEYSYDFSSSPSRKHLDILKNNETGGTVKKSDYLQGHKNSSNKDSSSDSRHQSSQSSVSISDVADLISEKSISIGNQTKNDQTIDSSKLSGQNYSRRKSDSYKSKVLSDDSGDFTESPVASLSNLSLDIHSD